MTTSATLKNAAGVVRQGWRRHLRHARPDGTGDVCAVGALERAGGIAWMAEETCPDALEALAAILPPLAAWCETCGNNRVKRAVHTITHWNNADAQTAENVALALEYAALIWDQQHELAAAALAETPEALA